MQTIFARGVYLGENSSQSASVEFVRFQRTNYARGRLQAFCPKRAKPFLDRFPRPALRQAESGGGVFYSASCSGSSSVMVGMKARASLPRPRCLI